MKKLNKKQIIKTLKKINFECGINNLGYADGEFRQYTPNGYIIKDYKDVKSYLLNNEWFLSYVEVKKMKISIKEYIANTLLGQGYLEWEKLNKLVNHWNIEISEEDILNLYSSYGKDIFNGIMEYVYSEIKNKCIKYIAKIEGKDINEINLVFYSCIDGLQSSLDIETYNEYDTLEEVYTKWKELNH